MERRCKPCLEELSNDLNKTYQLFASIPYNNYSGKSKMISSQ